MTLTYKAVRLTQAGVAGGGNNNYMARLTNRKTIQLSELSNMISRRSTLSKADIAGVVTALAELTGELLLENNTIQMGDLGTFSLHLKASPVATPEQVNPTTFKQLSLVFRASTVLKDRIKTARYTRRLT